MTHIQHIHTCSDAWILRLFAFDFCTQLCLHAMQQRNILFLFTYPQPWRFLAHHFDSFPGFFQTVVFANQYITKQESQSPVGTDMHFLWLTSPQENAWRKTQTPKMVVLWATIRKPAIVIGVAGPQLAGAAERATTRALMPAAAQTLPLVMGIDYDAAWEWKSTN